MSAEFNSKLLQFLSIIAAELHEQNKLLKEANEISRETVKEFKDETFKIDENVCVAIEGNKDIQSELRELNRPIGEF